MPPETHFFLSFARELLERRSFPLQEADLREELAAFRDKLGLPLDTESLSTELGGRCASLIELFHAIVRQLAGEAAILGEKTPEHLWWWRWLARAIPEVRFVAVIRDPRAVTSSLRSTPWARDRPVWRIAERWCFDQREVRAMRRALGSDRVLVLKYENVVESPDQARDRLAEFLGVSAPSGPSGTVPVAGGSDILPRREQWRKRALEPVTTSRRYAWKSFLTREQADLVTAICRREMARYSYLNEVAGPWRYVRSMLSLPLRDQARRLKYRRTMKRRIMGLARIPVGPHERARVV
jgi:hypothetical protein